MLYILMGIKLLSLPVSISYSHIAFIWLLFVLRFVIITSLYTLKVENLWSYRVSCQCYCLLHILAYLVNCFVLFSVSFSYHPPACTAYYCIEFSSSTPHTDSSIHETSAGFMWGAAVFAVSLVLLVYFFVLQLPLSCLPDIFIISHSLFSLVASNTAFWALCALTIFAQLDTSLCVISLVLWLQLVVLLFQSPYCHH